MTFVTERRSATFHFASIMRRCRKAALSIRSKLLVACLLLTTMTVAVGYNSLSIQSRLGNVATRIYDDAFLANSYLRSAQNGLAKVQEMVLVARAGGGAHQSGVSTSPLPTVLRTVLDDLAVAGARSMSTEGQTAVNDLRQSIEETRAGLTSFGEADLLERLQAAEADFEVTTEIFAADGFRYRSEAGTLVVSSARQTWMAMALAILLAVVVSLATARLILPALRQGVQIAAAIAAGRLDTPITVRRPDEVGQLLMALATMQASVASAMNRINAANRELAIQHARFDAALNNMTQALCLLDAEGRPIVINERFAQMFGPACPEEALPPEFNISCLGVLMRADAGDTEMVILDSIVNGRSIAVSRKSVRGGGMVVTFEDVTERRQAEERLAFLAHHDVLTGLPNRVSFLKHLEASLAGTGRTRGLALLSIDLDRFKIVNDTLGHAVGDALLRAVGGRLRSEVSDRGMVVRLGGDEFAIIMHGANVTEADGLAARVVRSLSTPFELCGKNIVIGACVGISFADDGPATADALLNRADLALYHAKTNGRSRAEVFESGFEARQRQRRELEVDMQLAVKNGGFYLCYQPCVSTVDQSISGFEALLRWPHAERGMIPPEVFIPLAEEIGLIVEIGTMVLRTACAEATRWPESVKVAVNLSPRQFRSDLTEVIRHALSESKLAPERLELEITESVLMQDSDEVLNTLNKLRCLGVSIALDDFGTGYSSLSYLQRFSFDKIKIDKSFVHDLCNQKGSQVIVRAAIGIGRSLGIRVNAEGIETVEQFEALCREGCDEVQGYLFSKPMPACEIPKYIMNTQDRVLVSARYIALHFQANMNA